MPKKTAPFKQLNKLARSGKAKKVGSPKNRPSAFNKKRGVRKSAKKGGKLH